MAAVGVNGKMAAASARAHTRKLKHGSSFQLPMDVSRTVLVVCLAGLFAWAYQSIQPPPPKTIGPSVTGPRIKLSDGRYLAYKEHGVPKDSAQHKIVFVHGFSSSKHDAVVAATLSKDIVEGLGVYVVSFDRPGYGESDPLPNRTAKSLPFDIEELADQLGLGPKFYVVGFSMGGQVIWSCLKYIPHRLAGAALVAPVVNYWWPGFPASLRKEAYYLQATADQWTLRVAHYLPWLTYWWNSQKWFPASSVAAGDPVVFSREDLELMPKYLQLFKHKEYTLQQGEFESLHRDMMVGFGSWDFDPMDLKNPFPGNEGSVHLWQGDEDRMVPALLQRYIAQRLPWVKYHELTGSGHMFPYDDGRSDAIITALVSGN